MVVDDDGVMVLDSSERALDIMLIFYADCVKEHGCGGLLEGNYEYDFSSEGVREGYTIS